MAASLEELEARRGEIRDELRGLDTEYAGAAFPDDAKARWNGLNEELDTVGRTIDELRARFERIQGIDETDTRHTEPAVDRTSYGAARKQSRVPDDVWDVAAYRNLSPNEDEQRQALRDGAMRSLEIVEFPHPDAKREDIQGHVARLLDSVDSRDRQLARHMLATGSPKYKREFGHYLATGNAGPEMTRAASLTTTAGGFAIPYTLDPTIILTSSGVINPFRQISRTFTIVGNTWKGVTSTGVTASYEAEATETTDGAPVLAQPSATVAKAQVMIPFSIEVGEDWGGMQSEMARLIQDAKDVVEASKFLTGTGTNEPAGILTGATAAVTTAATATFAVADLYSLEQALSPRFRARGTFVANKAQLNKIRQFDSYGGASLWVQLGDGTPPRLLDYPTYQVSTMDSSATSAAKIMVFGDFSQFAIIDRVGLSIEVVPHLFGTVANYPTGQRGLYAYWRNTSLVLAGGLTANSAFQTLKLL